jgi:hypothetical protein
VGAENRERGGLKSVKLESEKGAVSEMEVR